MNESLLAPKSETRPVPCFHGGAFFQAIGEEFDQLQRRRHVINADALLGTNATGESLHPQPITPPVRQPQLNL
jgi:hypothetical protein